MGYRQRFARPGAKRGDSRNAIYPRPEREPLGLPTNGPTGANPGARAPTAPSPLPPGLFKAICRRDAGLIEAWVRKATKQDLIRVTTALEADPWCALTSRGILLKAMAGQGESIPPYLLHQCVKSPELMPLLAHNPSLTPLQVEVMGQHLMSVLGRPEWPEEALARAMEGICAKGFEVGQERLDQLIQAASGAHRYPELADRCRFRIRPEQRTAGRAIRILAEIPQVTSPQLVDIIQKLPIPANLIPRFVILHPSADEAVWLAALDCEREPFPELVPPILAEHGPAAKTPCVRERLRAPRQDGEAAVLFGLLLNPMHDTFILLNRLLTIAPLKVAELMHRR